MSCACRPSVTRCRPGVARDASRWLLRRPGEHVRAGVAGQYGTSGSDRESLDGASPESTDHEESRA